MNSTEVMYADGSTSQFDKGGAYHEGQLAILRLQLLTAKSALEIYIKTGGGMQLTRNGATLAIRNVIAPLTDKHYPRSMNGKKQALADCIQIIHGIESGAILLELESEDD
jgi:hypothetical protein